MKRHEKKPKQKKDNKERLLNCLREEKRPLSVKEIRSISGMNNGDICNAMRGCKGLVEIKGEKKIRGNIYQLIKENALKKKHIDYRLLFFCITKNRLEQQSNNNQWMKISYKMSFN